MKSTFFKNFLLLTISTCIINIVGLLTNAFITNIIGTTVLGSFSLITNVFNFLVTISLFGIPLAITKIVSENDILSDKSSIYYSSKIACKFSALISVSVCAISIIFRDDIVKIFLHNMIDSKIIILLSLALPFMALNACFCGYFNALRKVNKPIVCEFLTHIVKSFTVVFLLYIKYPTYKSFAISLFLSEFVSFLLAYLLYKRDVKKYNNTFNLKLTNKFSIVKNIFRISAPISFTSFVRSGLSTLKHTLIPLRMQKFGFSYEYAISRYGLIHGIALPFILMPSIFINSFASLLLPEYSRYFAANNKIKIKKLTEEIFRIIILLSLYIAFVTYISSDYICFKLYKNNEVSYYVKILTPVITIIYLDYVVDSMLKGLDLQVNVMKINIIDLLISIFLIYFAIPYLGTFGYIIVIYTSEYINGLMSVNQLLKASKIHFKYTQWVILPLICMFLAFLIINILSLNTYSFISLIATLLIFTAISLFLYLLIFPLRKIKS